MTFYFIKFLETNAIPPTLSLRIFFSKQLLIIEFKISTSITVIYLSTKYSQNLLYTSESSDVNSLVFLCDLYL